MSGAKKNRKAVRRTVRKGIKEALITMLRERPRYMPRFVWRWCAKQIFTPEALGLIGGIYRIDGNNFVVIRGAKLRIK